MILAEASSRTFFFFAEPGLQQELVSSYRMFAFGLRASFRIFFVYFQVLTYIHVFISLLLHKYKGKTFLFCFLAINWMYTLKNCNHYIWWMCVWTLCCTQKTVSIKTNLCFTHIEWDCCRPVYFPSESKREKAESDNSNFFHSDFIDTIKKTHRDAEIFRCLLADWDVYLKWKSAIHVEIKEQNQFHSYSV